MIPSEMKCCYKCKRILPKSGFHKNRNKKDGLCSECKECHKERNRRWRNKNRDKYRELMNKWQRENREQYNEMKRKSRQRELFKKKSRIWNRITTYPELYPLDSECVFCGETEKLEHGHLDYEDNGFNYLTVCHRCNCWMEIEK